MVDNYSGVDIAPIEAIHTIYNLVTSLKNMENLNTAIIEKYNLLQKAINDDGYDFVLKELNKTKSLIEQTILEAYGIVNITEEYIEYIKQSYGKINY